MQALSHDDEFYRYAAGRAHALRSTAFLLCGDWHHAEDLTQTALLKLYLIWPRLEHHGGLDAYARRIIVRTGIDIGAIPARGRRIRRRRNVLAAACSATAVCGVVVLALFTSGSRDRVPVEPATPLPTSPATTTPSPSATCYLTEGGPCPKR